MELNARRTRFRNVAEELARKLQMKYVFGREFEELTQGTRTSPAYHGQATLSRWRLKNARVIGFGTSPGSGVRDGFCRVRSLFRNGLVGALL